MFLDVGYIDCLSFISKTFGQGRQSVLKGGGHNIYGVGSGPALGPGICFRPWVLSGAI